MRADNKDNINNIKIKDDARVLGNKDKILLMGNPNVGKSIFFTALTGVHAMSSNYAGTTVSYMEGRLIIAGENKREYSLIDVPGTYSLKPASEAEAVAARFIESGAKAVICVLDASNLERNLRLALEIRRHNIPAVYALNLTDVAERRGVSINAELLAQDLGAPVIPTVAVKKQGLGELMRQLEAVISGAPSLPADCPHNSCGVCRACPKSSKQGGDILTEAKQISRRAVSKKDGSHSFLDRLGEKMMQPVTGIPIAVLMMGLLVGTVVGGGRALRAFLLLPLVNGVIVPFFRNLFASLLPEGVFLNILTGEFGISSSASNGFSR